MPRTHASWFGDSPHVNGFSFAGFRNFDIDNNAFTVIRDGLGKWKLRRVSGGAEVYNFRFNIGEFLMHKILATSGVPFLDQNLPNGTGVTGLDAPYYPGSPEISGTPIVTSLSLAKKGIRIKDITIVHAVSGVAVTIATPKLQTTLFANNAAPVVTDMPMTGAISLPTQAQPYVSKLTVSAPAFITTDLTDLTFETAFTLANGTILDFYGAFLHFDYNLN